MQTTAATHLLRVGQVHYVRHAPVANHVVVAQQVPPRRVHVARAVRLVAQLAAAWGWAVRAQAQEHTQPHWSAPAHECSAGSCSCTASADARPGLHQARRHSRRRTRDVLGEGCTAPLLAPAPSC